MACSILEGYGGLVETRSILDGVGDVITVKKYKKLRRTTINKVLRDHEGLTREKAYFDYFDQIFSDTNAQTSIREKIVQEFIALEDDELLIASYTPKSGKEKGKVVEHYYLSPSIRRVIWLKDTAFKRGAQLVKKEKLGTYWSGFPLNNLTKEGGVQFPNGKKPEMLLQRIIELTTKPGDLVLDSFLGSGTTAAVAHKMGRRWIGIELGEHCDTHCLPRLRKVVDGTDQGGISKAVEWKGGGGFRYYDLAPSLLNQDERGHWIINPAYNADMLSAAVCKQEGFEYKPHPEIYWKQGQSTERDFIFVTTLMVTNEMIDRIAEQMAPGESLLICCKTYRTGTEKRNRSIQVKKIPNMLMGRCEFGKEDYSLNIINAPILDEGDAIEESDADDGPAEQQFVAEVPVKTKAPETRKAAKKRMARQTKQAGDERQPRLL